MTRQIRMTAWIGSLNWLGACDAGGATSLRPGEAHTDGAVSFTLEAWADNWIAAYLREAALSEESVPLPNERSCSAAVVAVTSHNPNCTGIPIASWDKACENEAAPIADRAPCQFINLAEPEAGKASERVHSTWTAANRHLAGDVKPNGGYDRIIRHPDAHIICEPDLETDNTILCRVTVHGD